MNTSATTLPAAAAPAPMSVFERFLTMIICIVLGTGIPTIPNYIITAAIAVMVSSLDPHSVYLDKKALKEEPKAGDIRGV